MPSWAEVISSLNGVLLLARRDTDGYRYFNLTAEGFWRSFAAVLFVAPIYFILAEAAVQIAPTEEGAEPVARDVGTFYFGKALTLTLDWIAFPVAMVFVTRILDLTRNYATFIIAFNWSSVLVFAVVNLPVILYAAGLLDAAATGFFGLVLLIPVLMFRWFVARTALDTTGLIASAVVLLEMTLSFAIAIYMDRVFG